MSGPSPPLIGPRTIVYAVCGGLLGACLTATGYLVDYRALYGELPSSISWELVRGLHDVTPLHWFADMHAAVLAIAAGLAGWFQDRALFYAGALERRRTEEQLRRLALHDRLTGLPGRRLLFDFLTRALLRARRMQTRLAVLHLGIDRFRSVNESLGPTVGDELLVCLARGLVEIVTGPRAGAPADAPGGSLFRIEGDQFVAVLAEVSSIREATRLAARILEAHERPLPVRDREILLNLSIGVALGPGEYGDAEELLQGARSAMQRSKTLGRARFEVLDRERDKTLEDSLHLETELFRALEQRQLLAWYQPIYALRTRRLAGFEALIRWEHPQLGTILPASFVPAAEASGMIVRISRYLFERVFELLGSWQQRFPHHDGVGMSVNLSPGYLFHPDLETDLVYLLCRTGADASRIHLEITESTLIDEPVQASEVLSRLRRRGFRIAVDDFGTGYSSLSMLHALPVDILKIDREFVAKLTGEEGVRQIVGSIAGLARKLELDLVAEGIETEEQLEELRALRCRYGQGYLLGRPMDADAAEERIELCRLPRRRAQACTR